jgi:hypothetical protein
VSVVVSPAAESLAGQRVDLADVAVQEKSGNGFWIGDSERIRLFVMPADAEDGSRLQVGDHIDVAGTLRRMPEDEADLKEWKLDEAAQKELGDEAIYLEASKMAPVKSEEKDEQAKNSVEFSSFKQKPEQYFGKTVQGTGKVTKVVSEQAFYLENGGKDVLAVLREGEPKGQKVEPGETVEFEAEVMEPEKSEQVQRGLDSKAKDAIQKASALLVLHPSDLKSTPKTQDSK